jgi:multimeric flavodoxin WrbA
MGKKVIVISASPRKGGNSDILCDEFIKGAQESGHEAEKIFLREKEIKFCTGCGYCTTNEYTECATNDDMAGILEKMLVADVIVFSTPIYFYSMSGQMKTFIDRMCAVYTRIVNKDFYYIMTAAENSESTVQFALGEFKGLMACLNNPHEKGYLFAGGVWHKGEVLNTDFPKKAYEMGKNV